MSCYTFYFFFIILTLCLFLYYFFAYISPVFLLLFFVFREATLMSRWEYYEIFESAFESMRLGKACLLKAICEVAAVPFRRSHTLTAQLAHIFLT